jgi:hypothetical protein
MMNDELAGAGTLNSSFIIHNSSFITHHSSHYPIFLLSLLGFKKFVYEKQRSNSRRGALYRTSGMAAAASTLCSNGNIFPGMAKNRQPVKGRAAAIGRGGY